MSGVGTLRIRSARPFRSDRPSQYALDGLHRALLAGGAEEVVVRRRSAQVRGRTPRRVWRGTNVTVVGMMGWRPHHYAAHAAWGSVAPFCFDIWEPDLDQWVALFRRLRPVVAMTTSAQASQALRDADIGAPVEHLPEAADPDMFDPSTLLVDRPVHVLELGRRFDRWHAAMVTPLAQAGRTHLFQPDSTTLVFPTVEAMRSGMASSAISVCFPSATTHPDRSGSFSTVTQRYFESMAAGCLVVGECPAELESLFGYNPVIEADLDNPAAQILEIVADLGRFQPHVERNYQRLLEVGTWQVRASEVLAMVRCHTSEPTAGG
jgi:hypothetical protein